MHTSFGPSSLPRRKGCPGSYREEFGAEKSDTKESSAGTKRHGLIEQILINGKADVEDEKSRAMIAICMKHLEIVLAGDEILPGGKATKNGGKVFVEYHMDHLPYSVYTDEHGTCDLVIVYDDHIILIDWKMGGHFVDHPAFNLQLKGYSLGLWDRFGHKPINVAISQPAVSELYQLQEWVFEPEKYVEFLAELSAIVEGCLVPGAPRRVGGSCIFCSVRHKCPARAAIYGALGTGFFSLREAYDAADADERGAMISMAKVAIDCAENLIDHARGHIKETGEIPTGYNAKVTVTGKVQLNPNSSIVSWSPDGAVNVKKEQVLEPAFPEVSKWKV